MESGASKGRPGGRGGGREKVGGVRKRRGRDRERELNVYNNNRMDCYNLNIHKEGCNGMSCTSRCRK